MAKKKQEPMRVTLMLIEPMLGTTSANPDLVRDFIASKAPTPENADEEVQAVEDVEKEMEKGTTIFPRLNGKPFLWDYQIKGFFKDACSMLRRVGDKQDVGANSVKLKAHKKQIDGLVFIGERSIPLDIPEDWVAQPLHELLEVEEGHDLPFCERPLRAQTAQGERIALARSEAVPAGTTMTFTVDVLDPKLEPAIEEWLDYGKYRGLCQWRNSGMGRFVVVAD